VRVFRGLYIAHKPFESLQPTQSWLGLAGRETSLGCVLLRPSKHNTVRLTSATLLSILRMRESLIVNPQGASKFSAILSVFIL